MYVLKTKDFVAFERMDSEGIVFCLNGWPLLFPLISSKDFNKNNEKKTWYDLYLRETICKLEGASEE